MSELLAPSGNIESFYTAISNGADAIYLGLDKFNARAYASNFNIETLKELVKFAHLRNVKVYVTMNTIVYDFELDEIYKTIDELAKIHVDALIIQDLAILNYVTNKYKSLEAHASTQMGIDDIYGAKLLKDMGATRVVFARETPIHVLRDIKKTLNIEIEAFIHGALCVGYSGNCLMSSMIGDRSGNRGRCAGCCRQLYTLVDLSHNKNIKTGYLLSMKDLNTSENINDLRFIDSLKIEGRMKEPNYVATVVSYYRNLLDNTKTKDNTLNKIFNRTYTKGFMNNESSLDITNISRPNNNGYLIGEVVKFDKNKVWIKLFDTLNKGDQLRFELNSMLEDISIPVNKMFDANFNICETNSKVAIIYVNKKIPLKTKVYKTKDIKLVNEANRSTLNKEYKKIDINMELIAKINEPMLLKVIYKNFVSYAKSNQVVEKALTSSTTKENIYKQLSKLNDTPYKLNELNINIDENIFIPLKSLNELRREAIDNLNNLRLNKKVSLNKETKLIPPSFKIEKPQITIQVSNKAQYEFVKSLGYKNIYFNNVFNRNNVKFKDCEGDVLVGGLNGISYFKNNQKASIVSDYSLNVSNYKSVAILHSLNVKRVTLSLEINKDNINNLITNYFNEYNAYPNLELIVYGRIKLMHTKYCPLKRLNMCGKCKENKYALKDKFESFPLTFNDDCTVNILNSKKLNILDEINSIEGINYYRFIFTDETNEEIKDLLDKYNEKLINKNISLFDKKSNTRGHFIKNPL